MGLLEKQESEQVALPLFLGVVETLESKDHLTVPLHTTRVHWHIWVTGFPSLVIRRCYTVEALVSGYSLRSLADLII